MPRGYYNRKDPLDRFMEKVEKTDSCWVWKAGINHGGYARFSSCLKTVAAHRWIYERLVGAIPEGYQIDHLCRNRACVNPEHLQAVPPRVNTLRGQTPAALNAKKTHCPQGHPLNEKRQCPQCRAEATKRWREQNQEQAAARRRELYKRPEAREKSVIRQRERRARDPEAYRTYMREYYRKRRSQQQTTSAEE